MNKAETNGLLAAIKLLLLGGTEEEETLAVAAVADALEEAGDAEGAAAVRKPYTYYVAFGESNSISDLYAQRLQEGMSSGDAVDDLIDEKVFRLKCAADAYSAALADHEGWTDCYPGADRGEVREYVMDCCDVEEEEETDEVG